MKLTVTAKPEIFQECPIVVASATFDLSQKGACIAASEFIDAIRLGIYGNGKQCITPADLVDFQGRKCRHIDGVELDWEE